MILEYHRFQTRAYLGKVLRLGFLGPIPYLGNLVFWLFLGVILYLNNNLLIFFQALTIWIFFLHILSAFAKDKLTNDLRPALFPHNTRDQFTYHIGYNLLKYEHLTFSALFEAAVNTPEGKTIAKRLGAKSEELLEYVQTNYPNLGSVNNSQILEDLLAIQTKLKEPKISTTAVFLHLMKRGSFMKTLLDKYDLAGEDFIKLLQWNLQGFLEPTKKEAFTPAGLKQTYDSFGRNWVLGFTIALDAVSKDITQGILSKRFGEIIIRRELISSILKNLSSSRSKNVLLLGKTGVGKKTLVLNLAYILRKFQKEHNLPYTRVLKLKSTDLLFGNDQAEKYLLNALKVAEASGNIILVIESISSVLNSQQAEMSMVISKFLTSPVINVIGIDNIENYHADFKSNTSINEMFTRFTLDDATDDETMEILLKEALKIEHKSRVIISYKSLLSSINLSKRFLGKEGTPGKAIDVLAEAITEAQSMHEHALTESHIRTVISKKSHVNVNQLEGQEKNKLVHLLDNMRKDVIGQDEALMSIVNSLKRARLGIHQSNSPLGTFLFLGTTGVGKTETAKALAKYYFGGEDKMVRLDMNEYSSPSSVYSITGSSEGGVYQEGFLTQKVQDQPFSLVLLDEIEKAHKSVLNTFLQILDEGSLIDGRGIKTDFRNTIIIATSNAGAMFVQDRMLHQNVTDKQTLKKDLLNQLTQSGLYTPEFLNRFDDILIYYPLNQQTAFQVAQKVINNLIEEFYKQRGVMLIVPAPVIVYLSQVGYSPEFGAREMKRAIKDKLENYLADYLLNHNVGRGQQIYVAPENLR